MKKIMFLMFLLMFTGCITKETHVEKHETEVEVQIKRYPWWAEWPQPYPPPVGHVWYRHCAPEHRHFEHESHHRR